MKGPARLPAMPAGRAPAMPAGNAPSAASGGTVFSPFFRMKGVFLMALVAMKGEAMMAFLM